MTKDAFYTLEICRKGRWQNQRTAAAISAAQRRGLDIPGDLSVTDFGDGILATTRWPTQTTARATVRSLVRNVYKDASRRGAHS
jgi:DNA-binding LacI/PurR family transcriptional regulator